MVKYFVLCLAVLALLESCTRNEGGPPVPELGYTGFDKFKGTNGKDSFLTVHLTFKDGDGDIGLTDNDSFPPYSYGNRYFYNLFAEFYSIENGVPGKVRSIILADTLYKDTVHFSQRIKNLTPEGADKSIKGKIDLLTPFNILDPFAPKPDSVYYEITLIDRKLNSSNTVKTPVIVLNL